MIRIGELARQSGVSVATLRAWEQRYGVPEPKRTAGGQRLYAEDDIAIVQQLRTLADRGWSLAAAAEAVRGGLLGPDLTGDPPPVLSGQFHEQILDLVPEAVIATDLEGKVVYWNPGAERLFGWPRELAMGQIGIALISTVTQRSRSLRQRALTQGKAVRGDREFRRRDGSVFRTGYVYRALQDGGEVVGLVSIAYDLTERDENARVAHLRRAELESISVLGLQSASGRGAGRIMGDAVRSVRRVLLADHVSVLLAEGDAFVARAAAPPRRGAELTDCPLARHTVSIESSVISNELGAERRFDSAPLVEGFEASSAVAVPIPARERPCGALVVTSHEHRDFTAEDVTYLQAIANIVASTIAADGRG